MLLHDYSIENDVVIGVENIPSYIIIIYKSGKVQLYSSHTSCLFSQFTSEFTQNNVIQSSVTKKIDGNGRVFYDLWLLKDTNDIVVFNVTYPMKTTKMNEEVERIDNYYNNRYIDKEPFNHSFEFTKEKTTCSVCNKEIQPDEGFHCESLFIQKCRKNY